MNFLAIDFGLKHTGLAFASTTIAEPLKTVSTPDAAGHIHKIIKSKSVDQIIIGLSGGKVGEQTKNFAKKLEGLNLPIVFHDETLSSQEAKEKLKSAKKKIRSTDHHFAAALILQDYLDHH